MALSSWATRLSIHGKESAGMSLTNFKANYRQHFTVMGGLDVQTTIGFGKIDFLKAEIDAYSECSRMAV